MIVGFTGTRSGLAPAQRAALEVNLRRLKPRYFHHGCCLGADAEAVEIVLALFGVRRWPVGETPARATHVVAHPCTLRGWISGPALWCSDECRPALPPLKRNQNIVAAADVLVACPAGEEVIRSGTWATVRAARRKGIPIRVVDTQGKVTEGKDNS